MIHFALLKIKTNSTQLILCIPCKFYGKLFFNSESFIPNIISVHAIVKMLACFSSKFGTCYISILMDH